MKNHKFVYKGFLYDRKVYLIKCRKTGGEFSTEMWRAKEYPQDICPCCKENVKDEKNKNRR
jgi:hypothetical protein